MVQVELFVPESLPWNVGCNEEIVVTVDHKPNMTQLAGVLVKDSQGLEVAGWEGEGSFLLTSALQRDLPNRRQRAWGGAVCL